MGYIQNKRFEYNKYVHISLPKRERLKNKDKIDVEVSEDEMNKLHSANYFQIKKETLFMLSGSDLEQLKKKIKIN